MEFSSPRRSLADDDEPEPFVSERSDVKVCRQFFSLYLFSSSSLHLMTAIIIMIMVAGERCESVSEREWESGEEQSREQSIT
jgi:hypothetical protein